MNWGFLVLCLALAIAVGGDAVRHGEINGERHNAWTTLAVSLLIISLALWAMHWRI